MAILNDPADINYKHTGQLLYVSFGHACQIPLGYSRQAFDRKGGRQKSQNSHPFQTISVIKRSFGIAYQGKRDFKALDKGLRFLWRTHSNEDHPGRDLLKIFCFVAQLRYLLSAEGSAKMSEKHQDSYAFYPELTQLFFASVGQKHL